MPRSTIIWVGLFLCSCRAPAVDNGIPGVPSPAERRLIEAAVTDSFFQAITRFDFVSLRRSVMPDFELIEDTLRLTMDGFVDLVRSFEGKATVTYRFTQFNTKVAGNTAWTSYRNFGDFVVEGQKRQSEWLETAVLVRREGVWRIDRLQSTVVRRR